MYRKAWWKSKTIWFNAASAGLIAVEASLHLLQDKVGPYVYLALAGVVAGGNVILRTMTTEGISKK